MYTPVGIVLFRKMFFMPPTRNWNTSYWHLSEGVRIH